MIPAKALVEIRNGSIKRLGEKGVTSLKNTDRK